MSESVDGYAGIYKPKNEMIQIQLRRYRDSLALSGGMVIIMSLWDIIKLVVGFFLGEDSISDIIETSMYEEGISIVGTEYEALVRIILWVICLGIILVFGTIVFLYHLYIGLNAFRVGRQKNQGSKKFYLILSFLSAIFAGGLIISNVFDFLYGRDLNDNVDFAFYIMEVTAFFNYIFILYSAYKIRILEKAEGGTK